MLRLLPTLRVLLLLLCVLLGAACRGEETATPRDTPSATDDADPSPIAGTAQGAFAVSNTGEATYTLSLTLPPGAAGMEPSLSVAYNSASGDGMLGVGFSLAGLSSVIRCPQTMAQDGQIRSVRYDEKDALCLDGARLVPVGSSEGVVEYRTVPDSLVKVLASKSQSKAKGNPADTLQVFTRSGLVLEYGGSADSAVMGRDGVIRSWLLRRTSDRSENTIEYEYLNFNAPDGHSTEHLPFRIRYTGNRGVLPSRTVQFAYEPKATSARRALFAGGLALKSTQQLASVSMFAPGSALVREYRFTYTAGAGGGRTVLHSLRECAADGACKPRTTFSWTGERPNADGKVDLVLPDLAQDQATPLDGWISLSYDEQSDTWEREPLGKLSPAQGASLFLDVNGDGLPDIVKLEGMTGQPVTVLNTGDSHGGRFGDEVQGVTDYIPGDLTALWGLACDVPNLVEIEVAVPLVPIERSGCVEKGPANEEYSQKEG